MTVTISRGEQLPFKGFFAQVRYADSADTSPALGRFMTRQHSTVDCGPGEAVSRPACLPHLTAPGSGVAAPARSKQQLSVAFVWLATALYKSPASHVRTELTRFCSDVGGTQINGPLPCAGMCATGNFSSLHGAVSPVVRRGTGSRRTGLM